MNSEELTGQTNEEEKGEEQDAQTQGFFGSSEKDEPKKTGKSKSKSRKSSKTKPVESTTDTTQNGEAPKSDEENMSETQSGSNVSDEKKQKSSSSKKTAKSKRLTQLETMLNEYKQIKDPAEKTARFVALLRHMDKFPERKIIETIFNMFLENDSIVSKMNFHANISNAYSHAAQKRLSYIYTSFASAAIAVKQKTPFKLDPKACRAAIQNESVSDFLMEKIHSR